MTLRLQAYCEANLQSKYDVKIGNLENITAGWESEIYAFALEHGRQSKRIREELVLRLYSGEGAGVKSAHEFQSIKLLQTLHILHNRADFVQQVQQLGVMPDIFLFDIQMDPYDGFDLLTMIRNNPQFSSSKVVALTASVMSEEVARLKKKWL